jgi:hypothetical protein
MSIYLYVKTHNKTGLKYLGKTTNTDPHSYTGSGTYWKNHLKKHGRDYTTEIIRECQTKEEVKEWGLYYSKLWNVVKSEQWANLTEESGEGGKTIENFHHTAETKAIISAALKGRKRSPEHIKKMSEYRKGKSWGNHTEDTKEKIRSHKHTDEFKKKLSEDRSGSGNPMFGKPPWNKGIPSKSKGIPLSEETKAKIKAAKQNVVFTKAHKDKLKQARAKQIITEETKAKMKAAQLKRWAAIKAEKTNQF